MRIKTGFVRRRAHHKFLKRAKGFRMTRRRLVKTAREVLLHAGVYAYDGRKAKKQEFRKLWITRINGALLGSGLSYSQFIKKMADQKIELDRKILAEIIQDDPSTFQKIIKAVK